MKKLIGFIRKNIFLIIILALGLFLRIYKPADYYIYNHDGDLASWIVKDVVVNHHFRIIGQETSVHGVFIGPFFYYLLIPFYLMGKMDPIGGVYLSALIGFFSIFSYYYVFSKMFGKKTGLVASAIYALSMSIALTDREVVPTTPVMLWSVWFLYCNFLLLKGRQKIGLILSAILIGLVWSINLALLVVSPLLIISFAFSRKKLDFKSLFVAFALFIAVISPFFVFEARHGFQQTKSIVSSVTSNRNYIPGTVSGINKIDRVFQLINTNTQNLITGPIRKMPQNVFFWVFTAMFLYVLLTKKISKEVGLIFLLWQTIYIVFFSFNSLNLSEYYLNGMNVIWIGTVALFISAFIDSKKAKFVGYIIFFAFAVFNLIQFYDYKPNQIGYVQKKALVSFIKEDSLSHGYPCIAVSYIADPGYNFGYRYFFYLQNMHVNQPISGSPVYTIVFPHSKVDKIDKSFGALGLIFPDYGRYKKTNVEKSCSGQNSNLTDPMFGYTE